MKVVASQGGAKVPADASVTSTVGIGPRSEGGFGLDIDLAVSLPGLAKADAEALVAKGPPGVPVFQRHPRQCGCAPDGRVTPRQFSNDTGRSRSSRRAVFARRLRVMRLCAQDAIAAAPEDR